MNYIYKILLIIILISDVCFYSNTFGQELVRNKRSDLRDTAALMFVDKMPEFHRYKGRNTYERVRNFIDANLKWPTKDHLNGDVFITCVVELDGSLSHFRILRGFNSLYDTEALRVLKLFPKWEPGFLEGIKVRVVQAFHIKFLSKKDKELLYKSKTETERVNHKDYSENSFEIANAKQKVIVNNNCFASIKKPGDLIFLDYDVIVPDLIRYGKSSKFYDLVDLPCLFYLDNSAINVLLKIDPQYMNEKSIDNYTQGLFIRAYPEIDFKSYSIKEFFNDKWALHLALFMLDGASPGDLDPDIYVKFNNTAIFTLQGPTWSSTYKAFLMNGKVSIWLLEETIE